LFQAKLLVVGSSGLDLGFERGNVGQPGLRDEVESMGSLAANLPRLGDFVPADRDHDDDID
jgi:hypothetical protein